MYHYITNAYDNIAKGPSHVKLSYTTAEKTNERRKASFKVYIFPCLLHMRYILSFLEVV